MRTNRTLFRLAALVALLLIVAGCGLLPRATPEPATPTTGAVVTFTPTTSTAGTETPAVAVPSDTAGPSPTPSVTERVSSTPSAAPATGTATNTPAPATPTFTNTPAAVPATATTRPTNTRAAPSATPSRTPTPPPARITDWRGEYFDDAALQPPAVVVRNDRVVDFQWSAGQSPAAGIPNENYSARWTRDWNFETGNYVFHLLVDDGARVWVGGNLIIDAWTDGAPREFDATLYLNGQVPIRVEYYNRLGGGRVRFNWDRVTLFPDWLGSYYKGTELSGLPYFQRNDPNIDFNWGAGPPRPDMPADNFSVRWSRRMNLDRAGNYLFQIVADDGVRFWVDGRLVIDAWRDGYGEHEVTLNLAAGGHDLRLDYYEHLGGALIRLAISFGTKQQTATFTPTPTATFTPTPTTRPPTSTFTPTPTTRPPTSTFTPTATGQPPTSTFTPTATGEPATATFTPTATGEPPTATFTPTPAPPPLQPEITVEPIPGEQGWAVQVQGRGWPANTKVDLFLDRSGGEGSTLVGQAVTDSQGAFEARVDLLPVQELMRDETLEIVARTTDGAYEARATVQVPREEEPVSFEPIPAEEERFALSEPTYLALDSANAWEEHFGAEPPPADPPVDWENEYVLGAFPGPQPGGIELEVESVTAAAGRIVVELSSPLPGMPEEAQARGNLPRALIRIDRDEVEPEVEAVSGPTFAFVDANGNVLAEGPAGAEPLGAPMALRAAPATEPGALALPPGEAQTPEAAAKEAPFLQETPEATAAPTAAAEVEAGAAPRTAALGWGVLAAWAIAVAALIAGLWLLIRRVRRG